MRYVDFRDAIRQELRRHRTGMTWAELRQRLRLPYARPCPDWVCRLQREIGLSRQKRSGPALVWTVRGGG